MLSILITVVHIVACFFLVVVVLLQTGKGADIGAVFGGSSQTIFGSSGAGNLLTRLTTWTAVVFMFTSLYLTWAATHHLSHSIADSIPAEPAASSKSVVDTGGDETAPSGAAAEGEKATDTETGAATAPAAEGAAPAEKAASAGAAAGGGEKSGSAASGAATGGTGSSSGNATGGSGGAATAGTGSSSGGSTGGSASAPAEAPAHP